MDAQLESQESSSPIVTRAVAAGLKGSRQDSYAFAPWQRVALNLLGRLPQQAARYAISRFEALGGQDPALLEDLAIDRLIQERLADYAGLQGPFPAIAIGAPMGGASAHLSLAMGGPFLPQAFVTTLRGGAQDGDVCRYFERSASLARRIAAENLNVMTIQHFDPVHDEWMTHFVNHLRFKLLDLPDLYREFILSKLAPGGTLVYLDCQAAWLRFRTGERSVFQVGGWGDLSPQEFLDGSPRLQDYCRKTGLAQCGWRLPGYALEIGPESEWGSEPGLGEALRDFCERHGYRFVNIRLSEPHDYSRLAFSSVQRLLEKEGRSPAGVFIEMFSQFDASAVMDYGLLPVWLVFNTWDSLRFLEQMRPHFPEDGPVYFSPLSTFTLTPDLVPWDEWERSLAGLNWFNVGARRSHYPADAQALVSWQDRLVGQLSDKYHPIRSRLDAVEIQELADQISC